MKTVLWISLFGFWVTVPHVAEDFVFGVPQKYGVSLTLAGILLAAGYFVQMIGIVLLALGRRAGLVLSLLVGSVWLAGALWDHLPDLLKESPYREGPISKVWIAGIILWGGSLAAVSFLNLRHSRRR
ncbi:MAG TPA: hypothetical protein VFA47_05565 [Candidatus Manganitrophaceae bacterium]|nr:hypothetical protein [Candidatus Manganitrophaceae bacterium]